MSSITYKKASQSDTALSQGLGLKVIFISGRKGTIDFYTTDRERERD